MHMDEGRIREIADNPAYSAKQKVERLKDLLSDVWTLQRAEAGGQSGTIVWDDYLRKVNEAIEEVSRQAESGAADS